MTATPAATPTIAQPATPTLAASVTPPPITASSALPAAPHTSAATAPLSAGFWARLSAVPAIWGGTFLAGHVVVAAMPPSVAALLRYLIASVALWLMARVLEGGLPRLDRRMLGVTAVLGLTGIVAYNLFFFAALAHLPASRTALLVALNPIVTLLLSLVFLGERLDLRRGLGVMLALIGVWVVLTRGDLGAALSQSVGVGEALMFGGVCSWAAYTLIGKKALKGLTPLAASTYATLWGTLGLALIVAVQVPDVAWARIDLPVIGSLVFLGVLGTAVAFVWYYQGVQRVGAARTVVFNNLVPVFGTLFGVTLLGEPWLASMGWGGGMAVAGVMLASGVGQRR